MNSLVDPIPTIKVEVLKERVGDPDGVIVVVVPQSKRAPHMVQRRYPVRRGPATDYMGEAEVARAYARRAELAGPPPLPTDLLARFTPHASTWVGGNEGGSVNGMGVMRLVLQPETDAAHPGDPRLWESLTAAVDAAKETLGKRISPACHSPIFDRFDHWKPLGTTGWSDGYLGDTHRLLREEGFAVVLSRPTTFSFTVTLPLWIEDLAGNPRYKSAWEWKVAVNLMSCLAIAGQWYSEIPSADSVTTAMSLTGWENSVAFASTRGRPDTNVQGMSTAPDNTQELVETSVWALRSQPEAVGRGLLDPWLAAFDSGRDVFGSVLAI